MSIIKPATRYLVIGVICLVIGIGIGVFLPVQSPVQFEPNLYELGTGYRFINPLLQCGSENFSRVQDGQVLQLEDRINSYISSQQKSGNLDEASIYFRELNGGQFFSINPDFEFIPASLLKVPLAMSIYQESEKDPGLLDQKVFFSGDSSPASEYFTAPTLTASTTYSVQQLVDAMLINSDNNAALLLTHVISTAELDNAYSNLGLSAPTDAGYTMTTAQYAGFFRVLYNATYLDHPDSEQMLNLLSQSVFKQGLVAGVPTGIVVAHKFGERGYNDSNPDQLHDCGIIYAKNPYLLCVVTQGGNGYDAMATAIAQISKMVYEYAGP